MDAYSYVEIDIDGLPAEWKAERVDARTAEPLPDLSGTVAIRLASPVASLPLTDLCGSTTRIAIVCDKAPSAGTRLELLRGVLRELESAGVPPEQVTLLIASHPHAGEDRPESNPIRLVGDYASRIVPAHHDPDDLRELDELGTYEGVPLAVNFRAAEAELLIALCVTSIESGAEDAASASAITMGLAGFATQRELRTTRFFDDRVESSGYARPLFDRVVREGARRAGLVFAVAALEDTRGCALDVRAGTPGAVDDALGEMAMTMREAVVSSSAYDVMLAEPGIAGPFGMYDASRAAINIGTARNPVLMRGGALILPIGRRDEDTPRSREFFDTLANASEPDRVVQQLQGRSLSQGEARAYMLARVMQRYHIITAGHQEQLARDLHFVPAVSVREAAELAESLAGRRPHALIVQNALRTIPSFSGPYGGADPREDDLFELSRFN